MSHSLVSEIQTLRSDGFTIVSNESHHGARLLQALISTNRAAILAFLSLLLCAWKLTSRANPKANIRQPPLIAPGLPLIGNLWSFCRDGTNLILTAARTHGWEQPLRIKLGQDMLYMFTAPDHCWALMKPIGGLDASTLVLMATQYVLGTPKHCLRMIAKDNSGPHRRPLEGSNVPTHERWRHMTWNASHNHLSGRAIDSMARVYQMKFAEQLDSDTNIGHTWTSGPDFFDYIQKAIYRVSIMALFGEHIIRLNPDLPAQFRDFHDIVPQLLMRWPQWLRPSVYRKRAAVKASIARWLEFLDTQGADYNRTTTNDPDWEPYYGTKYTKEIDKVNSEALSADLDGRASAQLGLMFGMSTNTVPAIFWTLFEVFRHPTVLAEVRSIAASYFDRATDAFDTAIFDNAYLKSVFHEVLRLRAHGLIILNVERDYRLDGWDVPHGSMVGIPSTIPAFNPSHWNTGRNDEWPLIRFWPERFIVDPADPFSGPTHPATRTKQSTTASIATAPYFSTQGLDGKYLPFGGGPSMCPGRHFALRETIITVCLLAREFDIEFECAEGWQPKADDGFFPFGVLPPKDRLAYRIRRRGSGCERCV